MAEGGDFDYEDPILDHDDDDDDQEVNTTGMFVPGEASTPYHSGEHHEMQTMMHEQSGLPDSSYEETPLLGAQGQIQRSWGSLTRLFSRASATGLETSYSNTGRLQVRMAGSGKRAYPLVTRDNNTGKEQLNPALPKEIKISLGKRAKLIIEEENASIQEQRQRLAEAENQERVAQALAVERQQQAQEIQNLTQQIERTDARITAIQEEQGSNLESETELNRLKQLKKIIEATLKEKKKELAGLEKKTIKRERKNTSNS